MVGFWAHTLQIFFFGGWDLVCSDLFLASSIIFRCRSYFSLISRPCSQTAHPGSRSGGYALLYLTPLVCRIKQARSDILQWYLIQNMKNDAPEEVEASNNIAAGGDCRNGRHGG